MRDNLFALVIDPNGTDWRPRLLWAVVIMERGEDETIDSSDNQDLTDEGGHLRGTERKLLHSKGGWQRIVCSYTLAATRVGGCMCLCGGESDGGVFKSQ